MEIVINFEAVNWNTQLIYRLCITTHLYANSWHNNYHNSYEGNQSP